MSEEDYVEGKGLPTQQWLEDEFIAQLEQGSGGGGSNKSQAPAETATVKQEPSAGLTEDSVSREQLLKDLYEVRDRLIDTFSCGNDQVRISSIITDQINHISRCASSLGAPAEHFDPLDHMSGLNAPNLKRNAENVIDNTKSCYQLGNVEGKLISEDAKEITIAFSGQKGDMLYTATGTIRGGNWQGNEAVDYVYTPGAGKMSVKAFEDGQWLDKSDKFDVSWELTEEEAKDKVAAPSNNEGNDFDIIEE
jgi:hypothetical protein